MRLRLAYLGITNAFALLRLQPRNDRDKDAEILALRHQLAVLHRQLGEQHPKQKLVKLHAKRGIHQKWCPRPNTPVRPTAIVARNLALTS